MPTAIYLGNDKIQIITGKASRGKLKIKRAYSEPLPEGVIINGIITDDLWLKEHLRALKSQRILPRGKVDLVVDSGDILCKTAVMPVVSEKKLKKLVAGEFAEAVAAGQDKLYDYSVLTPKNADGLGGTVLCTAADRSLVESYIDLFTCINTNLASIRLGLDCAISLCTGLSVLAAQTYILLLLDGNTMVSILFVEGKYFFSQRTRLLENRGGDQSAGELNKNISYITQFNKSQNSGGEISHVYLCGLSEAEGKLPQELSQLSGFSADKLPSDDIILKASAGDFHPSDYCYTAGCLL
ncbi:MAG: pilus assembly protein PilM [Angelakisella sp.]